MKTIKLRFKDKLREVDYILTNSGITISSIQGFDGPMDDFLNVANRNRLIIEILRAQQ